jgi:Rubredoxin-like zinc ribbon domain (DUF35_N)
MEIPRHWRLKAQRYRLEGSSCLICGKFTFPPRPVCLHWAILPASIELINVEAPIRYQITDAKFTSVDVSVLATR